MKYRVPYLHFVAFIALGCAIIFRQPWITQLIYTSIFVYILYEVAINDRDARENRENIKQNSEKQAVALKEAGNALTETLKIAFDGLKKLYGDRTTTQSKLRDHTTRIKRLEQHLKKSIEIEARREAIKRSIRADESPDSTQYQPKEKVEKHE
jgi:ABC-type bacteriocin/lantibiotic exporter with double-glycine peptidase domain